MQFGAGNPSQNRIKTLSVTQHSTSLFVISQNIQGIHKTHHVVVVVFSLHVSILEKGLTNHSLPALFSFFFFSADEFACTNSTPSARISPQWLTELIQL